jgi:serine O-acetyltransferase
VFTVFRAMGGRGDIHYRAEIGPGLLVLHPELGVVVSGHAVVGANLVLTGGTCLGERAGADDQSYVIGDNVTLGANAVVIGPVRIGDRVTIGAGAVVVDEAPDGAVLVGVPAKPVQRTR